ncbi:MAG: tetratricopeptide repeat protein [Candidatus Marinimicrobia bacterium]|nr:tetratricopeptide repeat protein [Candidatus Neomarinimicrobiota bacterium]
MNYENEGLYEKAIELFKKEIKIKPDDFHSYHNIGNSYCKLEKYVEAIHSYKQAIKIIV